MFNPTNNEQCISVGGKDGIFLWKFFGDTSMKETEVEQESEIG